MRVQAPFYLIQVLSCTGQWPPFAMPAIRNAGHLQSRNIPAGSPTTLRIVRSESVKVAIATRILTY